MMAAPRASVVAFEGFVPFVSFFLGGPWIFGGRTPFFDKVGIVGSRGVCTKGYARSADRK